MRANSRPFSTQILTLGSGPSGAITKQDESARDLIATSAEDKKRGSEDPRLPGRQHLLRGGLLPDHRAQGTQYAGALVGEHDALVFLVLSGTLAPTVG